MTTLNYYLLVFDHKNDVMLEQIDFGDDSARAIDTLNRKEREYSGVTGVNILLAGSDSIETVKATHSTYFPGGSRRLIAEAMKHMRQLAQAREGESPSASLTA